MPDQIAATVQYDRLEEKEILGLEPSRLLKKALATGPQR